MRGRILIGAVVALGVGATAWAQDSTTVTVELSPNRAGAPSALTASFTTRDIDRPPDGVSIFTPAGLRLDPRAVRVRCSDEEAGRTACPAASRIGTGEARAKTILGPVRSTGSAFLGVARSGEHAAVWLVLDGFSRPVRVPVRRSGSGYVIRLDRLGDGEQIPRGAVSEVSGTVRLDARSRTVTRTKTVRGRDGRKRRRKVRTTYHLMRNPRTCPAGGWTSRAELTTAGQTRTVTSTAACR